MRPSALRAETWRRMRVRSRMVAATRVEDLGQVATDVALDLDGLDHPPEVLAAHPVGQPVSASTRSRPSRVSMVSRRNSSAGGRLRLLADGLDALGQPVPGAEAAGQDLEGVGQLVGEPPPAASGQEAAGRPGPGAGPPTPSTRPMTGAMSTQPASERHHGRRPPPPPAARRAGRRHRPRPARRSTGASRPCAAAGCRPPPRPARPLPDQAGAPPAGGEPHRPGRPVEHRLEQEEEHGRAAQPGAHERRPVAERRGRVHRAPVIGPAAPGRGRPRRAAGPGWPGPRP